MSACLPPKRRGKYRAAAMASKPFRPHHGSVLWFYSHDRLTVRIETRYDNRTAEYVLVVHWSAGHRQEERFTTADLFRKRLLELEMQVNAEGLRKQGPPLILPDGWPDSGPLH
jgi:hypothetical protein